MFPVFLSSNEVVTQIVGNKTLGAIVPKCKCCGSRIVRHRG